MELLIASALKQVGEPFPFSLTAQVPPQRFGGRLMEFETPLSVEGRYVFDDKAFFVEGTVNTSLRSVCARCAEPFSEPMVVTFAERFVKAADREQDSEAYPFEGDRLCLDQAVMDNLFLQLPLTSVCRPDCRGLCPVCGINRNYETCSCELERPTGAFSALYEIRNDH